MCIICHIYTDIYLHGDSTTEELISHYYWLLVVSMVEYLMTILQNCSTSPNEARVKGIWSFGWPCGGVLHIRWIIIRLCIVITIIPENKSIGSHIYRHVYAYTFTYEYTYRCTVTCTYTFTHTHTYTIKDTIIYYMLYCILYVRPMFPGQILKSGETRQTAGNTSWKPRRSCSALYRKMPSLRRHGIRVTSYT